MRGLVAFLFFCLALASATLVRDTETKDVADATFLDRQLKITRLFYRPYQPTTVEEQVTLGKEYNIEANIAHYKNPQVVKDFLYVYNEEWMLPKGRVYSVMYKDLMNETIPLFELFYYANDFDTLYKTACWAREHINEEMFVFTFSTALRFREDTRKFYIPPLYEIFPNYFFTTEVMDKAFKAQMQGSGTHLSFVHQGENNVVVVDANYSSWYYNNNWEQRLTYFTEDIGWNTFYYNYKLRFPYWLNSQKYGFTHEYRGYAFYYMYQQILARYYMERLSNGMGEIPEFSWEDTIDIGYDPELSYGNGMRFPSRPNHFETKEFPYFLTELEDYERRIRDAVAKGYAVKDDETHINLRTPEGIDTLGNMVQGNLQSPDIEYYGYPELIARALLGNSPAPATWHKITPSALEFYQTTLRDPMFYQLAKRYYNTIFLKYQRFLTPYTKTELSCPGVKIENVHVDKMVTYMEPVETEITGGVYGPPGKLVAEDMTIRARQMRLNHKPFTVTTNIESEKSMKVVFRYFIGPKYTGSHGLFTLEQNRHNFFRLDRFVYELKSGKNTIERSSEDFYMNDEDWSATRDVMTSVKYALTNKVEYNINNVTDFNVFPGRLMLPKGTRGGMPFYFYVIVTPWAPPKYEDVEYPLIDQFMYGYPFDRPAVESHFNLKNMHFEDVQIFHVKETEINRP